MKAKNATKPKWTTVATQWIYDDKSRARLIARERRKERERVARIMQTCVAAKVKDIAEDNPADDHAAKFAQEQIERVFWNIKQAIKPAKKGGQR